MDIYTAIIFGILGIGLGLIIPDIANQIIIHKSKKVSLEATTKSFHRNVWGFLVILNGLLWLYAGIRVENTFAAILVSLMFTTAILISVVDLQIRLIPNGLVLLMFGLSIPFQIFFFSWVELLCALLCMVAVGLMFSFVGRLVGFEQVGAGDVKLAAVMGLTLGYPNIMVALIGMSVALIIFCSIGLALKKMTLHSLFPFAPFILFGTAFALIYLIENR